MNPFLILLTININPLLGWAAAIFSWAVHYVWIFCLLIALWIFVQTLIDAVKKYTPPSKGDREPGKRMVG